MVRKYVLIKEYNPAYDHRLRAYLRERRILGEREYSWKEAQEIIMDMQKRGAHDHFYEKYFSAWADHPDRAPDYFYLLCTILPNESGSDRPDLIKIAQLDNEARKRNQRILFTVEDAANEFYEFYDKFLTRPLAWDLESGADGNRLVRYFEYGEFNRVPDHRVKSKEEVESATQQIARDLLKRLRMITSDRILQDIVTTLEQHYDNGLAEAGPANSYNYQSDYARLSVHRSGSLSEPAKTFLSPSRGRGLTKEGYEGVFFPTYYVELAIGIPETGSNSVSSR